MPLIISFMLALLFSINVPNVHAEIPRPPQFIMLAFDGSKDLDFWEESINLTKKENFKFTYFISGVYFFTAKNRNQFYLAPGRSNGASGIGYSESEEEIEPRLQYLLEAQAAGNEIGSHANGHFDGSKWTYDQWNSEFTQFESILIESSKKYSALISDRIENEIIQNSVGFRAPLLGTNANLWKVLNNFDQGKFRYDTSRTSEINYWPKKNTDENFWNFPLVGLVLANSKKRTLSMDYNHHVAHKNLGLSSAQMEEDVFKTYMNYFKNNYLGNRAPLHLGHHFSKWGAGAYWRAMQNFAKTVCKMPEVRCIPYHELADFMDQNAIYVSDYQVGNFPKASPSEFEENLAEVRKTLKKNLGGKKSMATEESVYEKVSYALWSEEQNHFPSPESGDFYTFKELENLGISVEFPEGN
ncbi:MAG: polysaccharide deacetylase family protein [Bacteriovoracaceae bacterium]|nr:polysaccharide deacetylase family protein [Bacteriovoracaceae bacterium]